MKFSVATLLALAAAACAQQRNDSPNNDFAVVTHPELKEKVQAGTTYTIKWTVGAGFEDVLVNIILVGGQSELGQIPRTNITRGLANTGKYDWDVAPGLGGLPWNGVAVESAENPSVDYQYSTPFLIIEDPDYSVSSALPSTSSSSSSSSSSVATITHTSVVVITTTSTGPTSTAESSAAAAASSAVETETESSSVTPSGSAPAASSSSPAESSATQAKAGVLALLSGVAFALFL